MVKVNTIVKLLCEFVIFISAIPYWYRHSQRRYRTRHTIITFQRRQQSELWKWNRTKATNGRICSTSCVVYDDNGESTTSISLWVYVAAFRNINIKDLNSTVDTFVVVVGWRNWNISNSKSPKDKWTTFNRLSVSAESGYEGYLWWWDSPLPVVCTTFIFLFWPPPLSTCKDIHFLSPLLVMSRLCSLFGVCVSFGIF